jgi:hypothetical protein
MCICWCHWWIFSHDAQSTWYKKRKPLLYADAVSLFLDAFTKLRKATISFFVSIRPSVNVEQLGCNCTDCYDIWYLSIFRKSVEKIWVSLTSDKNNGYFKRRPINTSDHISLSSSQSEKIFQAKIVGKIKRNLRSVTFFRYRTGYDIMWKKSVELDRLRMTIWRMHIACWITKSTNTHTNYVAFPIHQLLQERPSLLRHSTLPSTYLSQLLSLTLNQFTFAHCITAVQARCNMFRPSAFCLFSSPCCLMSVVWNYIWMCMCGWFWLCVYKLWVGQRRGRWHRFQLIRHPTQLWSFMIRKVSMKFCILKVM